MSHIDSLIDHEDDDDMLSEFKPKIKAFFASSNPLACKDDLDKFLDSCGLLEIWNSEEEKNTVWQALSKHTPQNGPITYDSAIKGLQDLFTETTLNDNNDSSHGRNSSFFVSPSKQKALNTFVAAIDNDKYLQLKKINILLDMNNRTSIMQSEIQELLTKHKFIKLTKEEIIEFIQLLGDNNQKTKTFEVDNTLYTIAMKQIETKLASEQSMLLRNGNDFGNIGNELLYGNKTSNSIYEDIGDDGDPVELIDDIVQKEMEVTDVFNVLLGIKKSFHELSNILVNQYERYISGDDEKLGDVERTQQEIDKKLKEYDLFMKDVSRCSKSTSSKIEMLKTIVFKQTNKIKVMEDEYRQLYQQFTENQQLDIDDEMERLIDENVILSRDKEEKNALIDDLHKVIESKDNAISSYQIQCDDLNKEKEELKANILELTRSNDKLKNEYDLLVNTMLDKIQQEEEKKQQELMEINAITIDNSIANRPGQSNTTSEQSDIDIASINVHTITLPELHDMLKQMKSPNLIRFALKVSHDFQAFSDELNAKSKLIEDISRNIEELKTELNTLKQANAKTQNENNALRNKLDAYKNEAEINNCFRPSNVLGTRLSRMSRLSRLESAGTKNFFSPGSFSNVSSAAFFSGQKQKLNTNSLTTPFEYGDKVKCTSNATNATMQQSNAVIIKGDIDEIQEGNEDDEEDKEKSIKGGNNVTKTKNECDDDTGNDSTNKERTDSNKLIIGALGNGNDESLPVNKPKTTRHKQSKSLAFKTQLTFHSGLSNSFSVDDSNANDHKRDDSVQIHLSTPAKTNTSNGINVQHEVEGTDLDSVKNKSTCSLPSQGKSTQNKPSPLEQAIENASINEIEITPTIQNAPSIAEQKLKTPSKKERTRYKSSLGLNHNLTAQHCHNYGLSGTKEDTQLHRDFLNITKSKHFAKALERRNDKTTEDKLFSDHVFDIEWNDRKVKATLILTLNGIYLLNSEDYSEKQYHQRQSLTTIVLSTKNPNFIAFYFEDNEDLCLETMRRLEMLYYIRDNFMRRSDDKKLPIRYKDNVTISKRGKTFTINVTGELFIGSGNFECAQKFGYLYKLSAKVVESPFTEKLVVLTNVGLLYYDHCDHVNKPPKRLIPVVGSKISVASGSEYGMSSVFEVKTNMGELFVFAARSEAERDSWVDEFKKAQRIYEEKMKAIDAIVSKSEDNMEDT